MEYSHIESGDSTKDTAKIHCGPDMTERPEPLECDTSISDTTGEHPTEHKIAQEPVEAANCPDQDSTVNRQFQSKEAVSGANAFSNSEGSDDRSAKRFLNEETVVHEISPNDVTGCNGDDTGYFHPAEPSNRETGEDTKDISNIHRGPDTAEGPELLESDTASPRRLVSNPPSTK